MVKTYEAKTNSVDLPQVSPESIVEDLGNIADWFIEKFDINSPQNIQDFRIIAELMKIYFPIGFENADGDLVRLKHSTLIDQIKCAYQVVFGNQTVTINNLQDLSMDCRLGTFIFQTILQKLGFETFIMIQHPDNFHPFLIIKDVLNNIIYRYSNLPLRYSLLPVRSYTEVEDYKRFIDLIDWVHIDKQYDAIRKLDENFLKREHSCTFTTI